MNCQLCELVKNSSGFIVTVCDHCRIPLVVGRDHKPEFSEPEKEMIKGMFPNRKIRWTMKKIKSHAHAHLE